MRASSAGAVRLGGLLAIALLLLPLLSAKRRSAPPLTNVSLLTRAKHGSLRSLAAPQRCAPPSLAGIRYESLNGSLWPRALRRTSRRRI